MADDKIRGGDPEKRKKKAAAKPPADEDEERPRKKRPAEDPDDDTPKRKKRRRDADDDDAVSSVLSTIVPVGGSIFALLSLWLSVLSLVLGIASAKLLWGDLLSLLLPALWPIGILAGAVSFFTHKNKASYGSIAGNMRAILGILIGLAAMVLHAFLAYIYFANPAAFR